jgi:hypothetical protein
MNNERSLAEMSGKLLGLLKNLVSHQGVCHPLRIVSMGALFSCDLFALHAGP